MSHMENKRLNSRDAIIEAAFQTFGRNASASLNEIAEAAGVGRATLHRHFQGRDDLIIALAKIAATEIDDAVAKAVKDAGSWTESLQLSLRAIIPLADRLLFLMQKPLERHPEIGALYQAQRDEMIEAIEQARVEGAFASDAPTTWIAAAYDNLTYTAWQAVNAGELTPTQAADLAWRTLTVGLNGDAK